MKSWKVLTIDDDAFMQKLIKKEIEKSYRVIAESSGQAGINTAISELPDIILLDVEMPGMNGYQVCDTLKHNDATKHIPIIFLSSLSNIRSKINGYDAGGADFLVKPFDTGELISKLNALVSLIEHNQAHEAEIQKAKDTAFLAMKDSSELGQCINFIETTYAIKNFDNLANSFFNVCRNLGLHCSLMFLIRDKRIFYSGTANKCPALEEDVISTIFDKGGRFIDFGGRTQVNYPHVALLIKNMPLHDMETYGRYKDFFPFMLGATEAKVKSLEAELGIVAQSKYLSKAFEKVQSNLSDLNQNIDKSQEAVIDLLKRMMSDLDDVIPAMGLEEDQEKTIVSIIDKTIVSSSEVIDTSQYNSDIFDKTTNVLEKLVEQQNLLSDSIRAKHQQESRNSDRPSNNIEDLSDDVEIF